MSIIINDYLWEGRAYGWRQLFEKNQTSLSPFGKVKKNATNREPYENGGRRSVCPLVEYPSRSQLAEGHPSFSASLLSP